MRHTRSLRALSLALCAAFAPLAAHAQASLPPAGMQHPSWSKSANIYEVNIRQFTPEGTFNAFAAHLPRLKQMGVDILWIMPVNPIGEKNRKGPLGRPITRCATTRRSIRNSARSRTSRHW